MVDSLDLAEFANQRFKPFKLSPMFGTEPRYGIEDGNYTSPNDSILRNWQSGKKSNRIWKGTLGDAVHMCRLLNRDKNVMDKATKGVTSTTQVRYYANQARTRPANPPSIASFRSCKCGAKYKGDK